ncbi:putative mitochondrial tRNA pseudouridine synthase [Leptomonas pyrrhocoris]|uniref:Putative mitochondrial tRNA pseudouridine synthase n=1 Tax=Leptomonas pyrrhocoris TaxID=157538 RepID=A0A0N0DZI0_LEPPY|nr:putative mitochondrial tRNA pseudouridine synthase [Leptomonas pyrrhocoris]KPA85305.1 putative mitochondrial tRNA pseudouridine synthase [Leptomonas pyrrhocoris]|eukprot:XP_015663744.1 putative mitochondrial tRNA pseudouridine synthase [Leptomonas pyrrhocoris]
MIHRRRVIWRPYCSLQVALPLGSVPGCVPRRHIHDAPCNDQGKQTARGTGGAPHDNRSALLATENGTTTHRGEPWREWLSTEQLQRIDTLTYLLGHYPLPGTTTATAASAQGELRWRKVPDEEPSPASFSSTATALPVGSNSRTNPPLRVNGPLRAKKTKLAALNARALPPKLSTNGAGVKRESSMLPSPHRKSTSRLWADNASSPQLSSSTFSVSPVEKGPCTAVEVVERLAQRWLRTDRRKRTRQVKADAAEDAAWQALLQHPPHLFADDAAVYARFGMGAYVSPTLPGFTGLFRQQWQDFHVTEMVMTPADSTAGADCVSSSATSLSPNGSKGMFCDAVPLSRRFNFSIPPLPDELLSGEDETPTRERGDGAGEEPDLSFFAVDVKQRIQELRTQDVREKDRAAVAEVLLKEEQRRASGPEGSSCSDSEHGETETSVPSEANPSRAVTARFAASSADFDAAGADGSGRHFLQCTLHKQHIAHGNALAVLAQTLRLHPRSISVAGIKDYVGDTVQRVRLENVSPSSALAANSHFRQKRLRMTLSDFSYEAAPLLPGDLFGNQFRVVLRDVDVPKGDLADAIAAFAEKGFPNYYGCQRFSWFAGRQDAAFALLRHNWLAFAFLFLNFTGKDRTLRELLQRPRKYPHPTQDEYRRGVVRRLRQISIEPADLDVAPFLSCPLLNTPLTHVDGRPFGEVEELICMQLREAYFDLNAQSRRLTAQRLSSYLWNQVLTLRLHHMGGERVLDGDVVAPASFRQLSTDVDDRQDWYHVFGDHVTSENRHRYTIEDVVHPGFSFDAIALPDNVIGAYYEQICGKYALDWTAQHSRSGLRDFREPPRPIIRKPLNLSHAYNAETRVLTLEFALERGCYANVALSELMKSVRCIGSEAVTLLPLPDALWGTFGEEDPGHVTTLQDIYEGYEDGVGFMNDEAPVERARESETKVWDHDGPLFRPASDDPYRKAHRWGSQHLLRNSERREKEAEDMKRMLFDRPLAKQLREGEVDTYAGHIVPLPPNASAKQVYAKVMRRKKRYAGAPKSVTRMKRSTSPSSHRHRSGGAKKLPCFQSLNKNSWNFTW